MNAQERDVLLEKLQEQLDIIESRTLYVSEYLKMLSELRAIHPRYIEECKDHLNELGEAMVVVLQVKQVLLLHSNLKIVPE